MINKVLKASISGIGGILFCILPTGVIGQISLWDTTLIELRFQTGGGSVTYGTDLLFTGGNNNGGNNAEEFLVDIDGHIKRRRIITDTSVIFPTEVGRMERVLNEPFIYGAGEYFLNKFDTSGQIIWNAKYAYPFLQSPFNDFIQLRDKSVVAAGFRQFAGTGWDYFVTRIDSMGNTLWQIQYPHPNDQEATAITEMYDGSLTVGGNDGGKFRLLRIGLDGRLIQSFTRQESTGANRLFYNSMALFPDGTLVTSSEGWNGTYANDHMVFVFDKNLNVVHHEIDDLFPSNFIEVNEDSSYYIFGIDQNDSSSLYMMEWPYQKKDSLLISTGSAIKFPFSFTRVNDSSAFIVGIQDNPSPNDFDYWYGRLDGLKKPWVPDPCVLSPPRALLSYEYNYPVLTLYDSSKSGLKYHDTVYTWQWNTGNGFSGTDDSLMVFFDTAISKTLDVQLIISNWYECRDTLNVTLNFDPTGISAIKEWDVKVYPNPATDVLQIELSESSKNKVLFEIFDLRGNKLISDEFTGTHLSSKVHGLPSGMYFYSISKGVQIRRGKLIKQ